MKIRLCALIILLAVGLVTGVSHSSEQNILIGFPEDNMSNQWRAAQVEEIRAELKKYPNLQFVSSDAGGSVAQNISDIENMVSKGAKLLFLAPRDPKAVAKLVRQLRSQGVLIVSLTRRLENDDFDVFISPDDFHIAKNAAHFLAKKMNGKGKVLMLEGVVTTSTATKRKEGFLKAIRDYPGITLLSKVANYDRMQAALVVEELLRQGEPFDAIYAQNDAMASGARLAIKKFGVDPASKHIVGIDYLPETKEAILAGEQSASFTYPTCGKVGVQAALDLLNKKKVPRVISVPSELVTKTNVNQVAAIY
ncbi:MAG: substrate-binding domain-containing protein [Gammaproteobacteria bacterium]|nr:substrate-binding domain-containing protein [Gammaproteobacteria bacterium]MDH5692402.1 substrate-binding domain-containing protein [Gammaproteobacteria bacterium]